MSESDLRTVYVDDSDPNIHYSAGWTSFQGIPTAPSAVTVSATPMYGTVHSTNTLASFTYTFDGIDISVQFTSSSVEAILSCTVDGVEQSISTGLIGVMCSGRNFEPGSHELSIEVQQPGIDPVVFDNLSFTTTRITEQDLDFIYSIDDPEVQVTFDQFMKNPGDELDFTFSGYSIGAYAEFHVTPNEIPASLFYTIDGGPPVNFTITSPATASVPEVVPQLIFQSPRLSLGNHHLHLEYLGSELQNSTKISLMYVQVQNSQLPVMLDAVPPLISSSSSSSPSFPSPSSFTSISSSSSLTTSVSPVTTSFVLLPTYPVVPSTSSTSSPHPMQSHPPIAIHTIIIASVVSSLFVVLIFSLTLFLFLRRRRYAILSQIICCENPHIATEPQRGSGGARLKEESQSVAFPRNDVEFGENVIYRHHQDSGASLTEYATYGVQRIVVDVPPTYSVIGMPLRRATERQFEEPLTHATADTADIPAVPTINPKLVHLTWRRASQSHDRI